MKFDFKKAAATVKREAFKSSTLTLALSLGMLTFGGMKTYEYYTTPGIREAYNTCVVQKKTCTPEQMELTEKEILLSRAANSELILGFMFLTVGNSTRTSERYKKQLDDSRNGRVEYMGKMLDAQDRADEADRKLAMAEAKLAPYLADEQRKADVAADAAAKQQINQMATDATTLQGQIKVKKTITIKQPPQS